jgi:hypothetical protein
LAVAVAISGCAAAPAVPTATPAEQQSAIVAYMNCLAPFAKRLDDGRSDAQTIALAMRGACPTELEAVFETISRGDNPYVKQEIRARGHSLEQSSALQVVLDIRNFKANQTK